jgi:hypothetical protein
VRSSASFSRRAHSDSQRYANYIGWMLCVAPQPSALRLTRSASFDLVCFVLTSYRLLRNQRGTAWHKVRARFETTDRFTYLPCSCPSSFSAMASYISWCAVSSVLCQSVGGICTGRDGQCVPRWM